MRPADEAGLMLLATTQWHICNQFYSSADPPMPETALDSRRLRPFAPALTLLTICMFVNYIDRGNLSIAAPILKDELALTASQLGLLLSAFFWTYTAMQFVSGWLVDRFSVNVLIAAGYLLWSLATAATGLVRGFVMLLAMRLLLGSRRVGCVSLLLKAPGQTPS